MHVPSAIFGVCSCCMCTQLKPVPRLAAEHSFGAVVCGGNRAPYSCFGLCCVDVLGFRAGHRSACSFCSLACSWARLLAFACVVACALGLLALWLACLPACLLACGLAACSHSVGGVVSQQPVKRITCSSLNQHNQELFRWLAFAEQYCHLLIPSDHLPGRSP